MTLDPLVSAALNIQVHALSALIALVVGPVVIHRRRRDALHKAMGYLWVAAMVLTALSSFSIRAFAVIGPFSPIHLPAVLAPWSIWKGLGHAIAGRIRAHEATLRGLYWRGLILAALFNFLPGRVVNRMLLQGSPEAEYVIIVAGLAVLLWQAMAARQSPHSAA